jgi:hypothetical protein
MSTEPGEMIEADAMDGSPLTLTITAEPNGTAKLYDVAPLKVVESTEKTFISVSVFLNVTWCELPLSRPLTLIESYAWSRLDMLTRAVCASEKVIGLALVQGDEAGI